MSNGGDIGSAAVYKIKVKERLEGKWSEWLDGMAISYEEDGKSVLIGQLVDQAALHGLLIKIRDLGLTLVAVEEIQTQDVIKPGGVTKNEESL